MLPLEFRGEVNRDETTVTGLSSGADRSFLSHSDTIPACDGQTDTQTDGFK